MQKNFKKNFSCPKCGVRIENNYSKSIKKDPYKQALVDLIFPEFSKNDDEVVKKITELFPFLNFNDIFEEYNYTKGNKK